MKTALALFAFACTICAAQAAPAAGAAPKLVDLAPYVVPYKKFVLDNGLTLIVHEDRTVPLVAVHVWYQVGSRHEKPGKTGFAHLFEHFFFNGSEHHPHGFREAMDDLGATNRAGTTNTDRTNFFEDVPLAALERTLYLEADRMGFLGKQLSQAMLERERGVVQNEWRQIVNRPYGRVHLERARRMYPSAHPYSWPVLGYMEDVQAATIEDVRQWYGAYYGPNNAVITLAGDITPERALALVKKYFDGIAPGPAQARTTVWIPALESNVREEMLDQVPQTRIFRSYHAPNWSSPDRSRMALVAALLAGSRNSRLEQRLVYGKGLATAVKVDFRAREIAGTFDIEVSLKPETDPALAERELDAAIDELLERGPSPAELARVRQASLAESARELERLGAGRGRSGLLTESMAYGGSPHAYLDGLKVLANARATEVRDAGRRWLRAHHYTMTVKPKGQLTPGSNALDRSVLPPLGAAVPLALPAPQRATLPNGLKVMLHERHGAPIVNAALAIDAGEALDPPSQAGLAALTLDLLGKDTQSRDASAFDSALQSLGAKLSATASEDLSVVRLKTTTATLAPSLSLMADAVLRPAFSEAQVAVQRQRRLAQVAQIKADPVALAERVLPILLYGAQHAYGRPPGGIEGDLARLTRADVVNWHAQHARPGSATLVVAGDITMAQLMPAAEAAFGRWQGASTPSRPAPAVPAGGATRARIYLIDKPDAQQSVIAAAHLTHPPGHAADLAMEPVMRAFGQMATSRLNRNLRLDKHWSYGAWADLSTVRGQRAFSVVAPVQTDKTAEAMRELALELEGIAGARPIAGAEYDSIMRNLGASLPARFETIDALEAALIDSVKHRRADDYWPRYAGRIGALTEAQLAAAAQQFIRPQELVWLVVGDLRRIAPAIRTLGWGDVVRLAPDGTVMR